jgi:hypothetical protein
MQKKICHDDDAPEEVSSLDDDGDDHSTTQEDISNKSNISKRTCLKKNSVLDTRNNRYPTKIDDLLWDDSDNEHNQPIKQESRKKKDDIVPGNHDSRKRKARRRNLSRQAPSDVEDMEDDHDFEQRDQTRIRQSQMDRGF